MPCISRFLGITIFMYYKDHNPPHFHAKYNGREVQISIDGLAVLEGELSRRAMTHVLDWAELHQDELMENWHRAAVAQALQPIAPLE